MPLGQKTHTAGNTIRYVVDYSDWLDEGVSLSDDPTVALSPAFTATVTDITISDVALLTPHKVVFVMSGGSVNENFTLAIQIGNSRSEVKNDTMGFTIVAP
jgi:hypothetical protein